MKAVISERYGSPDTLKIREVATPTPKQNQVLVRVHASSINFGNLVLLTGKPLPARLAFGLTKPKYLIPGGDVAGIVEAIGEKVTQFQVGDEVYGDLSRSGWGALAEYVVADEKSLALKPSNLNFSEAAAVPMAATTALQAIRDKGMIRAGHEVLIHGASGGVGTFAVQIAKAFGADVTAVVSTRNIDILRSIGADHVIDYKNEDFFNHNQTFDVIFGVNGSQSISTYKRKLKENGVFIHVGGTSSQMYQTMMLGTWLSMIGKKKFITFLQRTNQKDLELMKKLIEEGKVKPIIDRSYSLSEVPKAFQYFENGHSQGKVIITI
ncbi:NAD(P)-dependent alcohol dehydrogenase [Ferdinandcohnia quinoae]|uniref:NAD(P)-dependent alcohol dehydrogenase n=1 Tax=Fredinandcohnia quinoae TaxID=2918902 RepID=A0AAW5DUY4_9BACI|nr:NAD(P)-dependent alcohol dehydrogenase [Fredinandcohnia sp. SECRCQ15]MCH1624450.1 NAD(P)-dependent alcohol dehydrogenase [Fredinandcohnia sp. SECRCQ15]